ncbi:hypothetical protein PLESTB_000336100 [Pleodorina starrii]|uniref:Uncharacterized protein n=1 Tax=Pleodorina starrii TaxID=330485 RepID=A0A9W6BDJ8_9CHLO|nr:hypothetical protein PLESTB_000336100 [Pleodorina starrii]
MGRNSAPPWSACRAMRWRRCCVPLVAPTRGLHASRGRMPVYDILIIVPLWRWDRRAREKAPYRHRRTSFVGRWGGGDDPRDGPRGERSSAARTRDGRSISTAAAPAASTAMAVAAATGQLTVASGAETRRASRGRHAWSDATVRLRAPHRPRVRAAPVVPTPAATVAASPAYG